MREDNAFFEWMAADGVQPIKRQDRAVLQKPRRPAPDPKLRARRLAALGGNDERMPLQPEQLLHPLDPVEWKRDGVQDGVYRNLRLGRYTVDARLDLLKRPLLECAEEVIGFVGQCTGLGIRTVLIHFGRSRDINAHGNLVKSCLVLWLPTLPEVMAFHSALPQHGGSGALYLLLRKNELQRQQNLERHLHSRA